VSEAQKEIEQQEKAEVLLTVRGMKKYFGGTKAVDDVSFSVRKGELIAIIGPNGAGKTTLFNLLTGFLEPDEGEAIFKGQNIVGKHPHDISRMGIGMVFQIATGLEGLTILENLKMGARNQIGERLGNIFLRSSSVKNQEAFLKNKCLELLETVDLREKSDSYPSALDAGAVKKLEVLRGVLFNADLFLLDEPFSGVSPDGIDKFCDILLDLHEKGETIIMVEHNVRQALKIVQRVVVLDQGKIIAEGSPTEIVKNKDVIRVYLGERYK
jgi:ABC-type branched-subunit amino acid transport system ATPase component